ncbi:coiled-coil domain-containing protein 86 [Brienomyrus brachyistius]|uniref:coiled-coil domain-containing protein 86 n=1 Tax=Brienomyrus brachyistius TaxID=42636 RepID=UPI0020B20FC8|nr:coiled-coil domain-containing protein 86 [Brienomyrus brachyistius]
MPKRQQKSQDECCANPESSVSQVEGDTGTEVSAPAAMRTRSGRRILAPSYLLDSEAPSPAKTSRRRLKSDVQRVTGSESSGDTGALQECVTNMDTDIGSEPEAKGIRSDASEPNSPAQEPPVGVAEPADSADPVATDPGHGDNEKGNSMSVKTLSNATERSANSQSGGKQDHMIPTGKPKSGRVWKNRNKQRFSSLLRDKPLRSSWEKKMEAKREKELVKKYAQQLKEEKAREKEEKRKRREEGLRRREENERKAEIVQVIRNPAKMKRMKKKQLRRIEKRDTLALQQKAARQNPSGPQKAAKRSQ